MNVVPSSGTMQVNGKRCHRIRQWIVGDFLYLARQLSVFSRQAHRGISRGGKFQVRDCRDLEHDGERNMKALDRFRSPRA